MTNTTPVSTKPAHEFWELLHEWRDTLDTERADWIEHRFSELLRLATPAPVPLGGGEVGKGFTEEDYSALQRAFEKLRYIAENSFPAKDHDLDGGMRRGTIRDAMLFAKSALKGYETALCHISDDMFSHPLQAQDAAPVTPNYTIYTTDSGDSTMGIALRQLRDEKRWREIAWLNADEFPDQGPHDYYPFGTLLRIPSQAVTVPAGVQGDAARRYGWLRNNSADQWDHPIVVSQRHQAPIRYLGPLTGEALDKAIDAAIASQAGKD